VKIPVESVRVPEWYPRKGVRSDHLAALVESLKRDGLLQPILVRPTPSGYELVDGLHRLMAARRAGLREVEAVVRPMSDEEAHFLAYKATMMHMPLSEVEEAEYLAWLKRRYRLTNQQLAGMIGKGEEYVKKRLWMLEKLSDFVRSWIGPYGIPASHALELAPLPPQVQEEVCRQLFLETYMDAGKPRRRVRKNLPPVQRVRRVVRELQRRGVEDPDEVKRVLHEAKARELETPKPEPKGGEDVVEKLSRIYVPEFVDLAWMCMPEGSFDCSFETARKRMMEFERHLVNWLFVRSLVDDLKDWVREQALQVPSGAGGRAPGSDPGKTGPRIPGER